MKMKTFLDYLVILFSMSLPLVLFIISGFLAYSDKNGWGWFLIIGLLILFFTKVEVSTEKINLSENSNELNERTTNESN